MPVTRLNLVKSATYRVVYQIPGVHRVPREMVARLIDQTTAKELFFSGRPDFGDAIINRDWVQRIVRVPDGTRPYSPRKFKV